MSESEVSAKVGNKVGFEGVSPILRVANLQASTDYYVQKLGFKLDWTTSTFNLVSRGRCGIFLSQDDQGHPGSWVWIGVEDAEELHEEYKVSGAKIRNPPTNFEWALEIQVEDLDGNVLRMGSEPRADEPIGAWLDMDGVRWAKTPQGDYIRVMEN